MSVLYIVLPIALLIAAGAVAAFMWVARSGQLDDLDSPPIRMLYEDEPEYGKPEEQGERSTAP